MFVGGLADAQRNRDLGISFRASVGGGAGYRILKSQRHELTVLIGPILVREVPLDEEVTLEEPASTDALAFAATNYSLFLNQVPEDGLRR